MRLRFWLHGLGLGFLLIGVSIVTYSHTDPDGYSVGFSNSQMRFPASSGKPSTGLGKVVQARSLLYLSELALPLSCGLPILTDFAAGDRITD